MALDLHQGLRLRRIQLPLEDFKSVEAHPYRMVDADLHRLQILAAEPPERVGRNADAIGPPLRRRQCALGSIQQGSRGNGSRGSEEMTAVHPAEHAMRGF